MNRAQPAEPAASAGRLRQCVVCRRSLPRQDLLRLVRGSGGAVQADPEGRAEGRGAYVCRDPRCLEGIAAAKPLSRSFRARTTVQPETIDLVQRWQRSASTR
ncbi:MAG: YlxR family protein [Thermoleophilaceae bacterium]|nr:YlxR family protein [Thermoleophilaceae bacterium]